MKILFITEFFTSLQNPQFSGGVETRTFYTAKYLSSKNQIIIFAQRKKGELAFETQKNLTIYRFGKEIKSSTATLKSLFSRFQFIFKCINKSKGFKVEIVEGSNFVTYIPTLIISKLKKIPKIAWYPDTLKGNWIPQFGLILGIIGEISETIFLKTKWDNVITISNSVKNKLIKHGVSKNIISVVYCGTEISKLKKEKTQNQLITISRLVKYKRVNWAIKLLKILENEFSNLSLTIIGSGPEERNLKNLTKKFKLENKIKFLKNIPNDKLNQEVSHSKLLIHPSLIEGFGIVLLDSSKFGVPFISADIPTAKELNKILNSGLLFKNDNFGDLINQTKKVLNDNILYQKLSQNGIINSVKFNWKNLSAQTEKIFLNVIKK